ncbi:serine hydrolase [Dictyocaulus viviparus]|uniref:Serine hydrolase n=1 Tax=Dictyocaulus viviparus TaxID=29172 RepID=A0A0D8XS11_DICVI|nr:serine hydrolase [Dictyocaulus viviparus]
MTSVKPRLRILCLHGYRQNSVLFREKTGSLRKQLRKYAEFEFISAPLVTNSTSEVREDARGWWFSREDNDFSSKDVCCIATGFEKSVSFICKYVCDYGPFDGILGFSQGASMAHLLLVMEKRGEIHLGIRFAILFSGFLSLSSVHSRYTSITCDIPTLHIYGTGDQIVLSTVSEKLMTMFSDNTVIVHKGGHYIPSLTEYKNVFITFLNRFLDFT